jgi:predicted amidohydrolase/WD40 repeat protein
MAGCRLWAGVLTLALAVAAAAAGPIKQARSPHGPAWRISRATSIAFSPDGKWVVASYWRHAMNRPGTDWGAFVAQWEVDGKGRTIAPNAYGPIAFGPDGKTLAMGVYKRSGNRGYRMRPRVALALWDVGKSTPRRILPGQGDQPATSIAAAAWSRDGKRLAALTDPIGLLMWDSNFKPAPVAIPAKSPLNDEKLRPSLRPGGVAFAPDGQSLLTTLAFKRHWRRAILWRADKGVFTPAETYSSGLVTRDPGAVLLLSRRLAAYRGLYGIAGKGKLAVIDDRDRIEHIPPDSHVRISRDGSLLAIGRAGVTDLRDIYGHLLRTFPAGGGAVAFSGDSKRIAAADARGIIRIWDTATSKLIRTLRLDDRKENTVLAAAVQIASKFGDPNGNRKKIQRAVSRAARSGAKIVVLPETAITGYMTYDIKTAWQVAGRKASVGLKGVDPKDAAETVPGPSTKYFASIARQYGIYLTVPLLEVDRKTGKYYNTSVLLGPDGKILIHYRKRNPWIWAEKGWAEDGDLGNPVVDTPYGRLGLLICFDVHKQFEVMSAKKIDTLLYSIAWVEPEDSDWFSRELPARTGKHRFNVIGANWTVPKELKPDWHGYGKSLIISSDGKVLSKAINDLAEETVYAEISIPQPK